MGAPRAGLENANIDFEIVDYVEIDKYPVASYNAMYDENYNIRHFTPIEVERLQTLPDEYTLIDGIKTKERYEACGNGWTVDVIAHIFKGLREE